MPTSTWDNLSAERRQRVLRAAMTEFGRHGYSAGSLNVVAREAGVAKGSLFQYFTGKLDFFAHVAEQTSLTVRAEMETWLRGPRPGQTFSEFLVEALLAWIDYFAEHPLERGVTAATNLEIDPEVRRVVRDTAHEQYLSGLRPMLAGARSAGLLAPDADLEALTALLLLLLPHLALAPFDPGFDAVFGLCTTSGEDRRNAVQRLVKGLLGGVEPA
ncbi:TetR/AcrR family transcriptional regulator [Umezawaea beigongshangensis]|uniref:TetR/AcrR family transcriptional regulator n=1 Tax=Umezawaea beigongshangensis TaxID=2780383 RepID=UPI0018F1DF11|nr:TetR/AcrR family transcriptional regulator [Umezawaea beigongshangensis]